MALQGKQVARTPRPLGTRKRVTRSRSAANAALLRPSSDTRRPVLVKAPIYVAVIARSLDYATGLDKYDLHPFESNRHDDGWYALMGQDRDALIQEALKKRTEFGSNRYEVWVGMLTDRVSIPTNFKLLKL